MGIQNLKKQVVNLLNKALSLELNCINYLLDKKNDLALELAKKLYNSSPEYLILVNYCKRYESKYEFLSNFKNESITDIFLIELLLKDSYFTYEDIINKIKIKFDKEQFYHLYIQKEILFKKYKYQKPKTIIEYCKYNEIEKKKKLIKEKKDLKIKDNYFMENLYLNFSKNKNIFEIINNLIKSLNDFSLYDFAIKHDIIIEKNETINYKWYKLMINKDIDTAKEILKNLIDFNEIYSVYMICNKCINTGFKNLDILIKFLSTGFEEWMIKEMINIYNKENNLFNLKILLALLISTRIECNLVLALFLSCKIEYSGNYEIKLIQLFLNRYFCFTDRIFKIFNDLNIKNIQCYNMAYIWSDPMIICEMNLIEKKNNLTKSFIKDITNISLQIIKFINQKQLGCAISLIEMNNKLKNMIIWKELDKNKIIAEDPNTLFSMLLGKNCKYLFDKLIINNNIKELSIVGNIFSKSNNKKIEIIFKNNYMEITDNYFISNFLKSFYNKQIKIKNKS